MPARIEGDSLFLAGTPVENRRTFLEFVRPEVYYYGSDEFKERYEEGVRYGRFRIGHFSTKNGPTEISDLSVSIELGAFSVNGESYIDLIPITIVHEVEEMWAIIKTGKRCEGGSILRPNSQAHQHALREQYRYAFSIGKAERYLHFLDISAPNLIEDDGQRERFFEENHAAYSLIKSRQQATVFIN